MNCQEAQRLIVPFINGNLTIEQAKDFFKNIDQCKECKDELEIYYVLLIGLKQLDEDASDSLNLHGQFETHLREARMQLIKMQMGNKPKIMITLSLIAILLVLITQGQQEALVRKENERMEQHIYESFPKYDPIRKRVTKEEIDRWKNRLEIENE